MHNTWSISKSMIAAVGCGIVYWLGGGNKLLIALIALVIIDYCSGLIKAIRQKKLNSEIGFRGIVKKILLFLIISLAFILEDLTRIPLREVTLMFFIVNESLSILENAAASGIPLPKKLKNVLEQIGGGVSQ